MEGRGGEGRRGEGEEGRGEGEGEMASVRLDGADLCHCCTGWTELLQSMILFLVFLACLVITARHGETFF